MTGLISKVVPDLCRLLSRPGRCILGTSSRTGKYGAEVKIILEDLIALPGPVVIRVGLHTAEGLS